jgi:hypothetical protein
VEGAETQIGARLLAKEDQETYYTKIGRFLKRSKLDELPQLFNVIRGEMRLVGPRPLRPIFLEQCEQSIPNYSSRFSVPPGITGVAQLRGGYYTSQRNKLRYDLIYIRRRSLLLDSQIVFLTFVKVLNRWFSRGFFLLFLFLFVSFIPGAVQPSLYVSIFGVRISLIYLFILAAAAWLFLKRGPTDVALYRGPLNRPLLLFCAFSTISALLSDDFELSLQRSGYYIVTGFLLSFLIVNTLATRGFILVAARVVALTSVLMSILGLFEMFLFNYTYALASSLPREELLAGYTRASSLLGNPVVLAIYLVLGLPLLLAEIAIARGQKQRDFWVVCATLSFVGIFFTQTRIGLLALVVAGSTFLARRLTQALSFIAVFVMCVLLLIAIGGPRFSPSEAVEEANGWLRDNFRLIKALPVKTWIIGGSAITPYPLVSESSADEANPIKEKKPVEIPNMHVTLALEHGIVGWCIILWLILSALWTMKQTHGRLKDPQLKTILWAIMSSLVGFLVSMNAMNVFYNLTLQVFFWSLIGIGLAIVVELHGPQRHNIIWRFGDAGDQ